MKKKEKEKGKKRNTSSWGEKRIEIFPRSTFNIYSNFNTKLIRIPETRGGNIIPNIKPILGKRRITSIISSHNNLSPVIIV